MGRGEEERRREIGRRCCNVHNSCHWEFKIASCTAESTSAESMSLGFPSTPSSIIHLGFHTTYDTVMG